MIVIIIRSMVENDVITVKQLLTKADLSCDHLLAGQRHYFVLENPQWPLILGAIGLEKYDHDGLLRTFVIERSLWNKELGNKCMNILLNYARQQGLKRLYLVTTASHTFFTELGFVSIDRDELPSSLLQTEPVQTHGVDGQIFVYYFVQ
jgi:amino-acid N-acetyltransferase